MSRATRVTDCPSCGAKILRGLNRDVLAFDTDLDHAPVDSLGEALAVLTGRTTYDLRRNSGQGHVMEARSAERIAGRRFHPVHAEHRCGQPLPAAVADRRPHHEPVHIDPRAPEPF